jgi:glucan 1,3-beta-glucosidase
MVSANFSIASFNPDVPTPLVQLGSPDSVSVGKIVDMIFTVSDVLQGCKLVSDSLWKSCPSLLAMLIVVDKLEVNMASNQPGDVGVWNSHFRVGGATRTKVRYNEACGGSPEQCKAA